MHRMVAAGAIAAGLSWGCGGGTGPSCLARQQRGTVTTVTGEVGPGQTTMHRVPYGTQGSQNDVDVTWDGQKAPDGPRIRVYATRVTCPSFVAPGGTGACASIGSMEGTSATGTEADFVQDRVSIVNGRGNPDILGTPAEYLLWVVGDRTRAVRYSMTATWFYGPDC